MKSLDGFNVQAWRIVTNSLCSSWVNRRKEVISYDNLITWYDASYYILMIYRISNIIQLIVYADRGRKYMNTEWHGLNCLFCYPRLKGWRGLVKLSKWIYMHVSKQVCQFVFQCTVYLYMLTKWRLEIQNATKQNSKLKNIQSERKTCKFSIQHEKITTQPRPYSNRINKDTFDSRETTTPNVI